MERYLASCTKKEIVQLLNTDNDEYFHGMDELIDLLDYLVAINISIKSSLILYYIEYNNPKDYKLLKLI